MKSKKQLLDEAIVLLENKQALELRLLKEQFQTTYESLKPINLIKSTFKEVGTSPDLKKDILNTALGLATGYLTKNPVSLAGTPVKKMLGTIAKFALAKLVSTNSDKIINTGEGFLQRLMKNQNGSNPELAKS